MYTEIIRTSGRLECINCGSHTYAKRCGTCEGSALIPVAMMSPEVRDIADALEADRPPLAGGVAA